MKVIVAMSGGVDSSVSAALLKKAGFDVVGIFIKFWDSLENDGCCSSESEGRARQVCWKMKIPFYVLNEKKVFKKEVVDYFINEYKNGRTPNPCVVCNNKIKFNILIKKTMSLGADFIATGHYAKIEDNKLLKGNDIQKDQSYFLWQLNQKTLEKTLFPVGGYKKEEVKKIAKDFNLPVLNISESQEVCFVDGQTSDFLKKRIKTNPGDIVYGDVVVGKHQGLWFYTVGQRKRIGLSGGPYYVVEKNADKNTLIVSKNEGDLLKKELLAEDINWISGKAPKMSKKVEVKIRYGHKAQPAVISKHKKGIKVLFSKPQKAITPGQSAVFYSGQELLGGGTIL